MPVGFIVFIVIFLIIFYVYTFIKMRKRRKANQKSIVEELANKYQNNCDNLPNSKDAVTVQIDFIDKEDFIKDVQKQVQGDKNASKSKSAFSIKPLEF